MDDRSSQKNCCNEAQAREDVTELNANQQKHYVTSNSLINFFKNFSHKAQNTFLKITLS